MRKKIIFVVGSMNQTTQMVQIAAHLEHEFDCFFTQFFPDLWVERMVLKGGFLENTIMSGKIKQNSEKYLLDRGKKIDYAGKTLGNKYDLAVLCTDMLVSRAFRKTKTVWVQEGMIDPMTKWSSIVHELGLPGYIAMNTSLNGTANIADIYCSASESYKAHIASMGTDLSKIIATGIPNFDNLNQYRINDFPHRDYVMVATSDIRECFGKEDRIGFLKDCVEKANGRQLLFKLHPNEIVERAVAEIKSVTPENTLIYPTGDPYPMIANSVELITQWSTLVYVGIVLGKPIHSFFSKEELFKLTPKQTDGQSAAIIADICKQYIQYAGNGTEFLKTYQSDRKDKAA